jgi:hypothetical protein
MKTKVILKHIGVIAIVLASVIVLGCMESQPKSIIISYSVLKTDVYDREAAPGKVFLLFGLGIENRGYKSFRVGPEYFNLMANNVKYDAYSIGLNRLYTGDVLDGGANVGTIGFEVPSNIRSYEFYYNGDKGYNIEYHQIT